jgi:glycosyltransferase involved in cell wall biosynthesis
MAATPRIVIDVILRTCNRAALLGPAVDSLLAAERGGVALRLFVVDNASKDGTPQVLADLATRHRDLIVPLYEPKPGGQHALNRALAEATAPIVAFFDDDERVAPNWLQVIRREFTRSDEMIDFIGGPCRPLWQSCEPPWLPKGYNGVLGIIDNGTERSRYSPSFRGMLTQGNCAIRRSIYTELGAYPSQLTTAEDRWLYNCLLRSGKIGYYCPDLEIFHLMQEDRLTRAYFRQWAKREGRDRATCDRLDTAVSPLLQPWFWRENASCAAKLAKAVFTGRTASAEAFTAELTLRQTVAYIRAAVVKD